MKGKQKLVTAFSSIQGHKPGVRSLNAVVDWQQQSGYLVLVFLSCYALGLMEVLSFFLCSYFLLFVHCYQYASGELSSIMLWDLDKEQLVNSFSSSSDCSISALVSFTTSSL